MRRLFVILLILALVFGASYAGALLSRLMGPWEAVAIERDGSTTHMAFGPNLPRPEWVPVYPGATVVQASRSTSARMPSGVHMLELATRAPYDDVRRFYEQRLAVEGFAVADSMPPTLNPATATFLGIAGSLSATRARTDDRIDVVIRTPDGLIPSRLLQITWRKISETPHPAAPALAPPN
jgi:hypothetical protein